MGGGIVSTATLNVSQPQQMKTRQVRTGALSEGAIVVNAVLEIDAGLSIIQRAL